MGLAQPVDLDYIKDEISEEQRTTWQFSTLDLVPVDSYLLICSGQASQWTSVTDGLSSMGVSLRILAIEQDFEWAEPTAGKVWEEAYGIEEDGAVLVRPDQHVEAVLSGAEDVAGVLRKIGHSLLS